MLRTQSQRGAGRLASVATLAALFVASGAQAQNLIPNSTFSTLFMLEGWPSGNSSTWSSIDSAEVPNSGSVRVSNSLDSTSQGIESVCVPIEEGNDYRISASVLWLDAESSRSGKVQLRMGFHDNDSCQPGGTFGASTGRVAVASDAWQHVEGIITAPAGYSSAVVDLWNWKDPGAGTFVAYFDDAELVSLPEPDASLLGIGAVAALVRLARVKRRA